jgi:hypothetical protein
VALWSKAPVAWFPTAVFGGEGLVAAGRKNAWICQLGRQAKDGPFAEWTKSIAAAPLNATETSVKYTAPGAGLVELAWDGPLKVDGREVALHDYARFENPYTRTPWGQARYQIAHAGRELIIDFARGQHVDRAASGARAGRRPAR